MGKGTSRWKKPTVAQNSDEGRVRPASALHVSSLLDVILVVGGGLLSLLPGQQKKYSTLPPVQCSFKLAGWLKDLVRSLTTPHVPHQPHTVHYDVSRTPHHHRCQHQHQQRWLFLQPHKRGDAACAVASYTAEAADRARARSH